MPTKGDRRTKVRRGKLKLALLAFGLTACRQDMQDQPKYIALRPSTFFSDGRSERPLVEGTVARGHLNADPAFYTGKLPGPGGKMAGTNGTVGSTTGKLGSATVGGTTGEVLGTSGKSGEKFVDTFPFPITREVLNRGQERFNIYCSPCHDRLGYGNGMIVRRGYRHPPSYHIDLLRNAPVGYIFDVITNGFGAMPDYAAQIEPRDRWAIVAYVRVLQFSQHASIDDVPAEARERLSKGVTK